MSDLGALTSSTLCFDKHIDYITLKANQAMYRLFKVFIVKKNSFHFAVRLKCLFGVFQKRPLSFEAHIIKRKSNKLKMFRKLSLD